MTTLLYIEDDAALRQLVRLIIARRPDMSMLEAATGGEGIEIARRNTPDIVLVDISLPDMLGNEVLHQLRQDTATTRIPAIAISGNSINHTRATSPGFDAYLPKPVSIEELYTAIDACLR